MPLSLLTHPRVEDAIDDIERHRDDHDRRREDDDEPLDHRIVSLQHGLDGEAPYAVPAEDVLDDDLASHQVGEHQSHDRHDADERGPEGMDEKDIALPQAPGTRG